MIREHIVTDLELTIINDGNGSQCGMDYGDRLDAGRRRDLSAFVAAAAYYNAMRVVDECKPANQDEIKEAAHRLLTYYIEHAQECDE